MHSAYLQILKESDAEDLAPAPAPQASAPAQAPESAPATPPVPQENTPKENENEAA